MSDFIEVLSRYGLLDDGQGALSAAMLPVRPLAGGLINQTYALGQQFVLQRLHPIFGASVNDDIAALVPALRRGGVPVPDVVRATSGETHVVIDQGERSGVWRVLTRLPGECRHKLRSPAEAAAAGAMLARFHAALITYSHEFAFVRPGAHDTDAHVAGLVVAARAHSGHRLAGPVGVLASEIADRWRAWGAVPSLPQRIIHGDSKVSNFLWTGDQISAVIDLDTMAWSGIDIELGDGLRSWCNLGLEDDPEPELSLPIFEAAVRAYVEGADAFLTAAERGALAPALERIALELAARFATDALNERYFGWDRGRFPTRGDHNLARAKNQLGLARAAAHLRPEFQAITRP